MQTCKYSQVLKCDSCDQLYYRNCQKFIKAHCAFLAQELVPFKFRKVEAPKSKVVQCRNIDDAKSLAVLRALKDNKPVCKYNINQALSLCLSDDEVTASTVFLDLSGKINGDPEKVKAVIESFVDKIILRGGRVVIYKPTLSTLNLGDTYEKI